MTLRSALLFILLVPATVGCVSTNYVPETGWRDNDWSADFYEQWFGEQLAAAREPSFVEATGMERYSSRFRLLILPTFSPASVYRVDEAMSGKMTLTYTRLSGAGGYEPGQIAVRSERELATDEALIFRRVRDRANLPTAQRDVGLSVSVDENGEEFFTICADGTRIVVEQLTANQSVFITRHECELVHYPELMDLYEAVSSLDLAN